MIRPAGPADVAAVVALEREAFGAEAWSERLVVTALPDLLVAEEGYAVVSVAGEVADLQRIAVRPAARREGAARALLAACVDRARDAGADRVLVEVSETNDAARAFYAATGFAEIDRRRRYYRDGTDALVLALPLTRPGRTRKAH